MNTLCDTRSSLRRLNGAVAICLFLGLAACNGEMSATSPSAAPDAADLVRCSTKMVPDAYADGLTKTGQAGLLKVVLVASKPAPPSRGVNVWQVKVLDASGAPVPNATFATIKPWMPDHGHGSDQVPSVAASGDGYTISDLYLFMAGLWQVPLTVTAGQVTDTVVFSFCIAG